MGSAPAGPLLWGSAVVVLPLGTVLVVLPSNLLYNTFAWVIPMSYNVRMNKHTLHDRLRIILVDYLNSAVADDEHQYKPEDLDLTPLRCLVDNPYAMLWYTNMNVVGEGEEADVYVKIENDNIEWVHYMFDGHHSIILPKTATDVRVDSSLTM